MEKGGLGFRDFHEFNIALLAKQLWRLLRYPYSFLARVLKGRYYRHSSPMQVERANNPSYGWRSIQASKEVLRKGLRKKIGNGHDTKVWDEPWLPTTPARPPINAIHQRDENLRVHHLIDDQSHTWNLNLVNESWNLNLVNEFVAAQDIPTVTSIRLSRTGRQDSYCWDFTKSGSYSVKSGYEVAHNMYSAKSLPITTEPSTTGLKSAIWKLKAPKKLKLFLWQATSGYLATARQLKDRHCARESTCARCGNESESINHTIFECPPALQCWALSPIPSPPGSFPCNSLFSNMDFLVFRAKKNGVSTEVLAAFLWIAWYIWKARNEKIFNNKDILPMDTLQLAVKEAESWLLAQKIEAAPDIADEDQQRTVNRGMQAQSLVRRRCQTDASWISKNDKTGLGFVLLEDGIPVLFGAQGTRHIASPLHAEAEGLVWAMQETLKLGNREIQFESDCEQLIKLIGNDEDWPSITPELDEIKALSTEFIAFSIAYIPRSSNVRADCLTKGGRSRVNSLPYVDCTAPCWLADAGQNRAP